MVIYLLPAQDPGHYVSGAVLTAASFKLIKLMKSQLIKSLSLQMENIYYQQGKTMFSGELWMINPL